MVFLVKDEGSSHLPASYTGVEALQEEFRVYQEAAFPEREARFFALELCGEAGELANLEKKAWKGRRVEEAAYADEAADVFIAVMNYANARGVDLSRAVAGKMAEIDRRRIQDSASGPQGSDS